MIDIKYAALNDKDFWYSLDKHLPETEFIKKVRDKTAYIIAVNGRPAGILRYNLFWDNTPFCSMLYIISGERGKGYGKMLMEYWEAEMRLKGFGFVLTSSRSDEDSQRFYRKLGYKDCGGILIDTPECSQPMEIFFVKEI